MSSWISQCNSKDAVLILLGDEWLIRASRAVAEASLENPRTQMIANSTKHEFEQIFEDSREYCLITDWRSGAKDFWLFELEMPFDEYLNEFGFELDATFSEKGNGLPDTYMGYLRK